ncbi:GTP-binding protein [Streptomyces cinnamoneus]|uniref:GTP-binding protein n=1 Tax=Streptomyces cinnamoneus TaxID=53446 RepID=UPI003407A56E
MTGKKPVVRAECKVKAGVIGPDGAGKTTLTSVIAAAVSSVSNEGFSDAKLEGKVQSVTSASCVEWQSPACHFVLLDWSDQGEYIKSVIRGAAWLDGAILLVSTRDGVTPETEGHIRLARRAGVEQLVVFVNRFDLVENHDSESLLKQEIRELLNQNGYSSDSMRVVFGSAKAALDGIKRGDGGEAVKDLLGAMDKSFRLRRGVEKPFLMPIEDVFDRPGDGVFFAGHIDRGLIRLGEDVEIVGIKPTRTRTVIGIEKLGRKAVGGAEAGENVSVWLSGAQSDSVAQGQVLAKPGSLSPHVEFEALAYIMRESEGGRATTFAGKKTREAQFYLHGAPVTGHIVNLCEDGKRIESTEGGLVSMAVRLAMPIALEEGQRFSMRDRGKVIGHGVVTEIVG